MEAVVARAQRLWDCAAVRVCALLDVRDAAALKHRPHGPPHGLHHVCQPPARGSHGGGQRRPRCGSALTVHQPRLQRRGRRASLDPAPEGPPHHGGVPLVQRVVVRFRSGGRGGCLRVGQPTEELNGEVQEPGQALQSAACLAPELGVLREDLGLRRGWSVARRWRTGRWRMERISSGRGPPRP